MDVREQKKQAKDFIKRWENRGNERQDSQSFWIDLWFCCKVLKIYYGHIFSSFEELEQVAEATQ